MILQPTRMIVPALFLLAAPALAGVCLEPPDFPQNWTGTPCSDESQECRCSEGFTWDRPTENCPADERCWYEVFRRRCGRISWHFIGTTDSRTAAPSCFYDPENGCTGLAPETLGPPRQSSDCNEPECWNPPRHIQFWFFPWDDPIPRQGECY